MREFQPPVSPALRQQIIDAVSRLLAAAPKVKNYYGRDLAMDDEELIVSRSAMYNLGDEGTITVALSEEVARPPFEWIVEITSEIGQSDYLKHYLVRDEDVVLAHRKVLTEVDDEEAKLLLADLKQAEGWTL